MWQQLRCLAAEQLQQALAVQQACTEMHFSSAKSAVKLVVLYWIESEGSSVSPCEQGG